MSPGAILAIVVFGTAMLALYIVTQLDGLYGLDKFKSKTVGDGQHGTARWATRQEIHEMWNIVPFKPLEWRELAREGKPITWHNPKTDKKEPLPQGIVVGQEVSGVRGKTQYCWVDDQDVHTLMIGAAGVGKTAFWLYPCIEYAMASGMSFLSTDTKGDIMRNYGNIAEKDYGYHISVIDLRNPTRSHGNNLLHLVNKYMDLAKAHPEEIKYRAKSEKYAKIIAKTIILAGMEGQSFGQNAYFYDAAEGLLTATILLVAEFCEPEKRHIVSVFKIIQELLAPSGQGRQNEFQALMQLLPAEHKAKWLAGSALNSSEQSMASVMSTALSRLNTFLDSELEQLLCFDTEVDAEEFCSNKSAVFLIMPEENPNTFFMISLIIQQLYREILAVADEQGGRLKNRCIFFCDEFGTLPKIESAEMMFSAARSRRLQIVPIIQSFAQLDKNYGKEGAEIIIDNTQLTLFGGFAPNSQTAEKLSQALGSRTVLSGSVSKGKDSTSRSENMMERRLMTPDELKSMPKGHFVCMKTGNHPAQVELKLYFEWGIPEFSKDEDDWYKVEEHGNRKVAYANREELREAILEMYPRESSFSSFDDEDWEVYEDPRSRNTSRSGSTGTSLKKYRKSNLYRSKYKDIEEGTEEEDPPVVIDTEENPEENFVTISDNFNLDENQLKKEEMMRLIRERYDTSNRIFRDEPEETYSEEDNFVAEDIEENKPNEETEELPFEGDYEDDSEE